MTHVLLTRNGAEKIVRIPGNGFGFAKLQQAVRAELPDRRWRIFESWESA